MNNFKQLLEEIQKNRISATKSEEEQLIDALRKNYNPDYKDIMQSIRNFQSSDIEEIPMDYFKRTMGKND